MVRFDAILITNWFIFEGAQNLDFFDLVSRGFWSRAVLQYGLNKLNVKSIFGIR